MISVRFQGKPFNITVIQDYALTRNAEEAEVEWLNEELEDLLELTPKKDVLFIIGDWNAKVRSQETPGVTGKFFFHTKTSKYIYAHIYSDMYIYSDIYIYIYSDSSPYLPL